MGMGLTESRRRESNSRPTHYECVALPTELQRLKLRTMVTRISVSDKRLTPLWTRSIRNQTMVGMRDIRFRSFSVKRVFRSRIDLGVTSTNSSLSMYSKAASRESLRAGCRII